MDSFRVWWKNYRISTYQILSKWWSNCTGYNITSSDWMYWSHIAYVLDIGRLIQGLWQALRVNTDALEAERLRLPVQQ